MMNEMWLTVKLNCARAMIRSAATFHLGPSTFSVSSGYEWMLACRPAYTSKLAQKVETTPETRTRAAVHA